MSEWSERESARARERRRARERERERERTRSRKREFVARLILSDSLLLDFLTENEQFSIVH